MSINGVDYTKQLARDREYFQNANKKLREATERRVEDTNNRADVVMDKQRDNFIEDKAELESSHKRNLDHLKDKTANSLEIERIYVLKEFLGKTIGQLLLEHAFQIAREKGNENVWLGVWEENKRAIRFYQKNGFEEFDKHIFMLGEDAQTDILMRKKLIPIVL